MKHFSNRMIYLSGFFVIALLLGAMFYLQYYRGVNPCALCVLQRLIIAIIGVIFFIGAAFHWGRLGNRIIAAFAGVFSLLGIFTAGRQVWLQQLPGSSSNDCSASLQYMIQVLPLDEVLKKVFAGSAECSEVGWQFLHLSLATWSLVCFCVLFVLTVWIYWRS